MTPSRPYLLRALYEWIDDNAMTPYILVDAEREGSEVPTQYVDNGKIVLNISPRAVQALHIDNDLVSFNARFQGNPTDVSVPVSSVLAIYARENGKGMVFSEDEGEEPPPTSPEPDEGSKKPNLRVVK